MKQARGTYLLGIVFLFVSATSAQASTVWTEDLQGDLSNDGLSPTVLNLTTGINRILGTTGNAGLGVDRDYFSFTVAPGSVLSSLYLLADSTVSGSASFIAIQLGPQVTVSPSGAGVQNLLGFTHYGAEQAGTDLLPVIHGAGALVNGSYAVWVQETGGPVSYGFDFVIDDVLPPQPVPVPTSALLMLSSLAAGAVCKRRKHA